MYEEEIKIISEQMRKRLEEKEPEHKNTWKTDSIEYLRGRINVMVNLYNERIDLYKDANWLEQKFLVDIANQSMLLWLRIEMVMNKDVNNKINRGDKIE